MKDLGYLNKALLSKWLWRFAIEREALWNDVIRAKYGEQERERRGGGGGGVFGLSERKLWCGVWKEIRRGWPLVNDKASFMAGNG